MMHSGEWDPKIQHALCLYGGDVISQAMITILGLGYIWTHDAYGWLGFATVTVGYIVSAAVYSIIFIPTIMLLATKFRSEPLDRA